MNKRPEATPHATCILLSDSDLEALRELALRRARLEGGRASAGRVVRELVRREYKAKFPKVPADA